MQFHTRSPRVLRASFAYHYFLRKLASHLHRMISTTMCRNSQSISRVFLWIDSLDWIGLDFPAADSRPISLGLGDGIFFPTGNHLHLICIPFLLLKCCGWPGAPAWPPNGESKLSLWISPAHLHISPGHHHHHDGCPCGI